MTKRIQVVALLLAVLLALSGCSMITVDPVKDAAEPVIKVNDETASKGDLQDDFNYAVAYNSMIYSMYGMSMTAESIADSIRDSFINSQVESMLALQKGKEMGLDAFDEEAEAAFQEEVDTGWADYLSSVESYAEITDEMTDEEKAAAEVAYLEENGMTREIYEAAQRDSKIKDRVREDIIKDVAVTEDEVKASYDEKVASDEETYTDNALSFEQAMTNGTEVAWIPEGYRTVLHILLKYDDERAARIDEINSRLTELESQIDEAAASGGQIVTDAEEAVEDAADAAEEAVEETAEAVEEAVEDAAEEVAETVEGETSEDTEEPAEEEAAEDNTEEEPAGTVITLDELVAEQAELQAELAQIQEDFLAEKEETIAEIRQKLADGEDIRDLVLEYGEDTGMATGTTGFENGYYVCADSQIWEQSFTDGAMALEKIGDLGEPVFTTNGIHLIYYLSDVQGGPVDMETLRAGIEEDLLSTKQDETYSAAMEEWKNAATIKTWPDRLQYTGN